MGQLELLVRRGMGRSSGIKLPLSDRKLKYFHE
jgi:hypothetical protein